MTHSRLPLARLFSTATLIAALGAPLAACAQSPEAVESESEHAAAVEAAAVSPAEHTEPEASAEPEKTPEQLAREAEQEELDKLQREARIRQARLQAELAPLQEEKQRIEAEISLLSTRQQAEQARIKLEKDQADFEQQMQMAEMARKLQEMQQQFQQMQVANQIGNLERQNQVADLAAANAQLAAQAAALQAELSLLQTQRSAASIDKDPMQYPANPLNGKTLTISDRRIPLNGAIGGGTADYVTERIHYYNNLDAKAPIFIVIDSSPGGSVMEGYRIVTAMQNSEAPVYVVVKSFAASMAACITTLAEESYAYPNAIILHHQMSSSMRGNLTQQKEALEEGFEWARRLAVPVAEKMGVGYDEFVKQMYQNNSDGDWAEFADEAAKLKWVDHIVTDIRETALVTAPTSSRGSTIILQAPEPDTAGTLPQPISQWDLFHSPIQFETKVDGNGRTYTELPPLQPFDYYFMYDPDGRYNIAR